MALNDEFHINLHCPHILSVAALELMKCFAASAVAVSTLVAAVTHQVEIVRSGTQTLAEIG